MVLSKSNEDTSKAALAGLPSFLRNVIQNSTIKLEGQNERGHTFRGSGSILCTDGTDAWIVTAKHNLYIYGGHVDPPEWSADLVTSFRDRIEIFYDGPMTFNKKPERKAAISEIQVVNMSEDHPWDYDVMILKSRDASLRQFAVLNSPGKIRTSDYGYLTDHRKYLGRAGQIFIQAGYGKVRETVGSRTLPVEEPGTAAEGGLQYRSTTPIAAATARVHNVLEDGSGYHRFDGAIQITADSNSSTYSGDSGGPLYAAYFQKDKDDPSKSEWRLHLLGVTTGADMSTAERACPAEGSLRDNNISTSLEYCYRMNEFPTE